MTPDTVGHVPEDKRFAKLNPQHIQFLDLARNYAREWAVKVRSGELVLNPDPPMPMRLRVANNWRVLFAIADAFGVEWGERARAAAVALERERTLIDPGLLILQDIREAFASAECYDLESLRTGVGTFINSAGVKTFASLVLAKTLAQKPPWDSWIGLKGKDAPHELRQGDLAAILRAFGIRPRTQWPPDRCKDAKSCNGYPEDQFESVWKIYCPNGAEAQPSPLAKLFKLKQ